MYSQPIRPDELYHFGIKGMKWGRRRYQNPDGSYTSAGRSHYGIGEGLRRLNKKRLESASRAASRDAANLRAHGYKKEAAAVQKVANRNAAKAKGAKKSWTPEQRAKAKKIATGVLAGAAAVGVGVAVAKGARWGTKYSRLIDGYIGKKPLTAIRGSSQKAIGATKRLGLPNKASTALTVTKGGVAKRSTTALRKVGTGVGAERFNVIKKDRRPLEAAIGAAAVGAAAGGTAYAVKKKKQSGTKKKR